MDPDVVPAQHLGQSVEAGVHQGDAIPEPLEALARRGEGHRVAIEAQHPQVPVTLEQRLGVASATDGGVEDRTGWYDREQVDDLRHHDGLVPEAVGHCTCAPEFVLDVENSTGTGRSLIGSPPANWRPSGCLSRYGQDGKAGGVGGLPSRRPEGSG